MSIDFDVPSIILIAIVILTPIYSMMWKLMVSSEDMKSDISTMKKAMTKLMELYEKCPYCHSKEIS